MKLTAQLQADKYIQDFLNAFKTENMNNNNFEGLKAVKLLKLALECDAVKAEVCNNTMLYRGRIVHLSDYSKLQNENIHIMAGFDKYDSKEPPIGMAPKGRNNFSGASYLYLNDDKYTTCAELRPRQNEIISLATFRIKRDLNIVDFSENKDFQLLHEKYPDETQEISLGRFFTEIFKLEFFPIDNDIQYACTQYISDLIRKYGFDGIKYRSNLGKGRNYTIFNCSELNIEFLDSVLVQNASISYEIVDLKERSIIPKNDYEESVEDDNIQMIINQIKKLKNNPDINKPNKNIYTL